MGDTGVGTGTTGAGGMGAMGSLGSGGNGNGNGGVGVGGSSPGTQAYTLPGVLHFMQVEWRRFERERNEWAIERNELRARVGSLEGTNRGLEQLKTDMTRRVKMLEFALRQERAKYLQLQTLQSSPSTASLPTSETPAPSSQTEIASSLIPPTTVTPPVRVIDRASTFGPVSTLAPPDRPPTSAPDRPGTAFEGLGGGGGTFLKYSKGWGTVRSREILRNYLQEADHLSTLAAPVPASSFSTSATSSPDDLTGRFSGVSTEPIPRARATPGAASQLPPARAPQPPARPISNRVDEQLPTTSLDDVIDDVDSDISSHGSGRRMSDSASSDGGFSDDGSDTGTVVNGSSGRRGEKRGRDDEEDSEGGRSRILQGSATMVRIGKGGQGLAGVVAAVTTAKEEDELSRINPGKLSRAIKSADAYTENRRPGSAGPNGRRANGRPDDLATLELDEDDTGEDKKTATAGTAGDVGKIWKPKFALRNHLDTVRSVAWHPTELVLFSAGEDSVAKMWDLRQYGNLKGRRPPTDIEPTYTFRGHTAAVTSLAVSMSAGRTVLYTGGADSTVRAWLVPFGEGGRVRESYASYHDTKTKLHTFVGHSDAVWDVKPHPIPNQYPVLASASADGTVKLWSLPDGSGVGGYKLKATLRPTSKAAPTSVDWCHYDLTKIVVGYTDATTRLIDVSRVGQEGDGEVLRFARPDGSDGLPSSQINQLVSHPTTPLCVAAYEDRYLRFLDLTSGTYAHQIVAHLDGVATVDIHPGGLAVASGGHDYSIRFWDMNTRVCSQEISAHRRKYDEGVWSVAYRPSVYTGWFASGGADGLAKVYTLES
ncbi:hypothetical protein HDU93_008208 [Gonapodya sp. JEL0774]|nr:hypothetical protein HDU93_008208 [Gonapodya sp. JEL0774]